MTSTGGVHHLVRRAVGSWSNSAPLPGDLDLVRRILTDAEYSLWSAMQGRDQRHSLHVLARFDSLLPDATRQWRAAALLHDVGKTASDLGWALRILATLFGRRGRRFNLYHDHERIGAEMLRGVSDPETAALVSGHGDARVVAALRDADDI